MASEVEIVNFKIASLFVSEHKDYNLLVWVNYESQSACVIGSEVGSGFIFPIRSIAVILIYCSVKKINQVYSKSDSPVVHQSTPNLEIEFEDLQGL